MDRRDSPVLLWGKGPIRTTKDDRLSDKSGIDTLLMPGRPPIGSHKEAGKNTSPIGFDPSGYSCGLHDLPVLCVVVTHRGTCKIS